MNQPDKQITVFVQKETLNRNEFVTCFKRDETEIKTSSLFIKVWKE